MTWFSLALEKRQLKKSHHHRKQKNHLCGHFLLQDEALPLQEYTIIRYIPTIKISKSSSPITTRCVLFTASNPTSQSNLYASYNSRRLRPDKSTSIFQLSNVTCNYKIATRDYVIHHLLYPPTDKGWPSCKIPDEVYSIKTKSYQFLFLVSREGNITQHHTQILPRHYILLIIQI